MANIICQNCGAEFDEHLPKCPYCDALNPGGAEAEYMDKLHGIRRDMNQLGNSYTSELTNEAKEVGGVVKKTILLLGIAVIVIGAISFGLRRFTGEMSYEEEYLWKQEHFAILDDYYETEDYDRLIDEFEADLNDQRYAVFDWDHVDAVKVMSYIREARPLIQKADEEGAKADRGMLTILLSSELETEHFPELYPDATRKEVEMVQSYGADLIADRALRFPIREEELDSFFSGSKSDRILDYEACEAYVEAHFGRK